MPNITGRISASVYIATAGSGSGCFSKGKNLSGGAAGNSGGNKIALTMDASDSNPIYGNSSTVTPLSMSTFYVIRYKILV